MQYAARLPALPSRRSIVVPAMALVLGAAAAVGANALIDDRTTVQAPDKLVFADVPAPGDGVRGLGDTAKAATIGSAPSAVIPYLSHGSGAQSDDGGKHESATAAAIGSGADQPESGYPAYPHGPMPPVH